jgi:hypothetical protein
MLVTQGNLCGVVLWHGLQRERPDQGRLCLDSMAGSDGHDLRRRGVEGLETGGQ